VIAAHTERGSAPQYSSCPPQRSQACRSPADDPPGSHALPYHRTGKHRRIRFDDPMKFKVERDQASERAMSELAKQAQELKLGYE
jgi:hypothetical protein